MTKIFGIRHHGPGSAKAVRRALTEMQPDCILIEAPSDAEKLIDYVANKGLKPPVSILIYADKNLQQAAHVPFAQFSPEWQTMKYGLKNEVPIRFMDLPMDITFALSNAEKEQAQLGLKVEEKLTKEEENFRRDPMKYLAKLAGYNDSERWWEAMFEQAENETEIFDAILEMNTALRAEIRQERPRTLLREAYMRKIIRKAVKDGFQNIAVVCGAWHSPVLDTWAHYKQSADNALLKGLKKVKTQATWVPWSYNRLTFQSGYMAGVNSPAWYEMLFSNRKEATIRWMVKVARLFRTKDVSASSAHAIEATRLAETLASLRGLSLPGIEEMKEAATSIFCDGDALKMRLIEEKLIVGDVMGKVPPEIPVIPLQKDLDKQIKTARLTAYRNTTDDLWLKANAKNKRGGLDLRTDADLLKSHLLHRLNVLNIPWGKMQKETGRELSTFKEYWKMKWKPDFALRIIEAGMWGNTVYEAAGRFLLKKANEAQSLPDLTEMVESALNANLSETIEPLVRLLEQKSAVTNDILNLMDALPSLVNIVRYGDVRGTETDAVAQVTEQIVPRICIGLPTTCSSIDEDAANNIFQKIIAVNHALNLLNNFTFTQDWQRCLRQITGTPPAHPSLKGLCLRILFDKNILDAEQTATETHYALSSGQESFSAALWLEGFLYGSGLVLIHHPDLWQILDEWINGIASEEFTGLLPVLRRTFANFSPNEREEMMRMAKGKSRLADVKGDADLDENRAAVVLPTVRMLLGYD